MEKINVAELLRNCPSGMKLDCTLVENLYFDCIIDSEPYDPCSIRCYTQDGSSRIPIVFNEYGHFTLIVNSKCVIFPVGKTTWEGFQRPFEDGDILAYTSNLYTTVFIYRKKDNEPKHTTSFYVGYTIDGRCYCNFHIYNKITLIALNGDCDTRFATEEEKQKLFQAIKENGYRWNEETKILEELVEPKFKVGDKIRHKCPEFRGERIIKNCNDTGYFTTINDWIGYKNQDDWELVSNKFDINTLVPFESRVLVRSECDNLWRPAIFGFYLDNNYAPYYAVGGTCWEQCIPYEGNEHLRGKINDCDEFFRTWEKTGN